MCHTSLKAETRAVVDNAGLVGFIGIGIGFRAVEGGGCAAGVGRRSVGCCGGGVGKGNGGFWKTVSKTKSGLFEVLIVSKWNWKVWVVPFSFLRESGRWNGFLSAIWVRSLLHSTVKEFACSLKQVMEMVAVPSLTIAFKQ
ncbi:hypothetical protein Tco_0360416 [Tanacetum coccineum]